MGRHRLLLSQQQPCHSVLPDTTPDTGAHMPSRAVLGGHEMCAWAAGPAASAPSPAELLRHDGCARRRGEPGVEQLPGNRLLSRPTLRPLSPSQGPFFFHSSSFLTGARPYMQVRNCSQCHQQPLSLGILGTHGPRRGREEVLGEMEGGGVFCGRPSLAVEILLGHFSPWLYHLPLPNHHTLILRCAVRKKPESSPFS